MKGDFTRNTFDPAKHYSRVLLQQGRVALDADWNEQSAITLHFLRALAKDLIGPHGGPGADFKIITGDEIKQLRLDEQRQNKLIQAATPPAKNFVINSGHYYVDGILIENDKPILYNEQVGVDPNADLPSPPYLVYVDVWERHITYLDDPKIREVALGGPDTATRAQIIWQVNVIPPQEGALACDVTRLLPTAVPQLRARAKQDPLQTDLCTIPPDSRYRGPENQLYRVEVHKPGTVTDGATFKWSRENGCVVFPIVSVNKISETECSAILGNFGRSDRFGLKEGDWVEILDEAYVLQNLAPELLTVTKIDREQMRITLKGTTKVSGQNKILRRWDGVLPIVEHDDNESGLKETWTPLEDGVQVWFKRGGKYQTGDYWLIPARTTTGDVEWPQELKPNGDSLPKAMPPNGPKHHYAPLATREGGTKMIVKNCRCVIQKTIVDCSDKGT